MARRSLADLVNQRAVVTEPQEPEQQEPRPADVGRRAEEEGHEQWARGLPYDRIEAPPDRAFQSAQEDTGEQRPTSRPAPKYLRLQRKEARFREDQLMQLTALARRISREKSGKSERITENTLLRVAVDLLLAQEDDIRGETEEQIQAALGLRPRA